MKIVLNNSGLRTLQNLRSWQTNNEQETMIEFEPIFLKINNCLHINSTHLCADGKRKKSTFIHVLTLGDVVTLRDFLTEVLNTAEYKFQIHPGLEAKATEGLDRYITPVVDNIKAGRK